MAQKPARRPRTGGKHDQADKADAKRVAQTAWDDTETLKRHVAGVRRVVGSTVTWDRFPTEAEQTKAAQVLGRILSHAI